MTIGSIIALGTGVLSSGALAQTDAGDFYIYGTYYVCDVTRQDEADAVMRTSSASIYDDAVEDGMINGWGWLAHHTGGPWRRAFYFTAPSMTDLLDAQESLNQQDESDFEIVSEICGTHEDYIWRRILPEPTEQDRGSVSLSAYYECDQARAPQADEIVEAVYAPVYQEQVEAGLLLGWGWNEHVVGGKYRRLATMAAEDWDSLFEARENIIEAGEASDLANEFFSICPSHADYMWDIQIENP